MMRLSGKNPILINHQFSKVNYQSIFYYLVHMPLQYKLYQFPMMQADVFRSTYG